MGIKLKNKFIYVGVFIFGIYMITLSALSIYDVIKYRNFIQKEPYFHSLQFENEVRNYCENIKNLYGYYKNYDEKFGENKATKEDMDGLKLFYEDKLKNGQIEIKNKYKDDINEAEKNLDKDKINKLIAEKNSKLEQVKKENTKSDEEIKKEVASRYDKDYENIKKSIQSRNDIKYYIKNLKNKDIYSNLTGEDSIEKYIKNKALFTISFPLKYADAKKFEGTNAIFKDSSWNGYIIIPMQLDSSSYILDNYIYYNSVRDRIIKEIWISIGSLIIGLLILTYIKKQEELEIPFFNKIKKSYGNIPLDLRIFMFVIYTFIMCIYLTNLIFFYKPFRIDHAFKLTIVTVYVFYFIFNAKAFIKLNKNRQEFLNQWQRSLLYKLSNVIKESSINKNIKFKIIAGIVFPIVIGVMIITTMGIVGVNEEECIITLMICAAVYIFLGFRYIFKKVDLLNKILKGTEEIVSGNLDYVLEEQGEGTLSKLAYNINNMKTGYKKSVEEQVKSERLKSELITNVSHDLKTPLTSIINYINLLKKDDLPEEQVKAYISVLERKAERLRVLIEDLFEAAKMSSGSVKLNIEKVDVKALLKQSIAELDEKIKNASLTVKFKCSEKNIYANLDGKKTWRVFENLINNIIKYSQVNTRVYIDLMEENEKIIIIMKNISSYEMDFDVKEIFHRFKRGDKSRNTEGSGLGLAIANGIVRLQGGDLKVQIDGDLFKVIVVFYKEKL